DRPSGSYRKAAWRTSRRSSRTWNTTSRAVTERAAACPLRLLDDSCTISSGPRPSRPPTPPGDEPDGRDHAAQHTPGVGARPQEPSQDSAQTLREPGCFRRRLSPLEGAEPPKDALLHTPFKTVDEQVVAPVPGQTEVPRQFVPIQGRDGRPVGNLHTAGTPHG